MLPNSRSLPAVAFASLGVVSTFVFAVSAAHADRLVCRKVVAESVTGESRNALKASRVKCAPGEMLTGGVCYPEERPGEDGSCQTSAMGIIQTLVEHPGTTEEAFFTCLQTGGTDCPVEARTRAMAICCKMEQGAAPSAN